MNCSINNEAAKLWSYFHRQSQGKFVDLSNKSLFKSGIVFGFGLVIPFTMTFFGVGFLQDKFSNARPLDDRIVDQRLADDTQDDKLNSIEILNFKDVREGDFVMVLGSIKNNAKKPISSVTLEAEFYNSKGEFVYEETTYISQKLKPGQVENFAIKCGCANRKFPEYSKVTVKVTSVSDY